MYSEDQHNRENDLPGRRTARVLITLSDAAMSRRGGIGVQADQTVGLEEVDEILRKWDVKHIRVPFRTANVFQDPEILKLSRTLVVSLGKTTDLLELRAELLEVDAVEDVEFPGSRSTLIDNCAVSTTPVSVAADV